MTKEDESVIVGNPVPQFRDGGKTPDQSTDELSRSSISSDPEINHLVNCFMTPSVLRHIVRSPRREL
jgi:hypothetical protein